MKKKPRAQRQLKSGDRVQFSRAGWLFTEAAVIDRVEKAGGATFYWLTLATNGVQYRALPGEIVEVTNTHV